MVTQTTKQYGLLKQFIFCVDIYFIVLLTYITDLYLTVKNEAFVPYAEEGRT